MLAARQVPADPAPREASSTPLWPERERGRGVGAPRARRAGLLVGATPPTAGPRLAKRGVVRMGLSDWLGSWRDGSARRARRSARPPGRRATRLEVELL